MPDVSRIDDRLAWAQFDDIVLPVDLLDEIDPAGEQHDELITGGVTLPGVPRLILRDDAHEPTFVAVARERIRERLQEFRGLVEVGDGDGAGAQAKVNERS